MRRGALYFDGLPRLVLCLPKRIFGRIPSSLFSSRIPFKTGDGHRAE
jgi:hypothetical protein